MYGNAYLPGKDKFIRGVERRMHLLVPVRVVERRRVMTKDDEPKPFLLIARCRAKPENVDAYVDAARVADEGVRASEPGMLHHTFVRDPVGIAPYILRSSRIICG